MTIDEFCEITGQSKGSIMDAAQINRSVLSNWNLGKQSPSLLSVITLFLISDGHITVFDLLSDRDKVLLSQFLDRLPDDRIEELVVELQKSFNEYHREVITDYLDDKDLL